MARKRMVTRTIDFTEAQVMCLDTITCNVQICTLNVTGRIEEAKMLKTLQAEHETDTFKLVKIESYKYVEQLYGMSEDVFIKLAEVLPER